MINVEIIKCLKDNFSYVLIDGKNCIVIDPSESKPIVKLLNEKKLSLKYILNTHHHFDHVDGNLDLKKRYNCKIIGFEGDKNRIPGIDISMKDKEHFNFENFSFYTFHTPGHTSGHVCFSFPKEKFLFTGDTLFSLSCGRLFEGSYEDMYRSLNFIKSFDEDTQIFCGHEYTLKNSEFCSKFDPNNEKLKKKILSIKENIELGKPTIPTKLKEEIECNIFLKAENIVTFTKLRELKDNF